MELINYNSFELRAEIFLFIIILVMIPKDYLLLEENNGSLRAIAICNTILVL